MSIVGFSHNSNGYAVLTGSGNVFTITNSINAEFYYIYTLSWIGVGRAEIQTTTGVIFSGGGVTYEILASRQIGIRRFYIVGVYSTINTGGTSEFIFSAPVDVMFCVDRFRGVIGVSDIDGYVDDVGSNASTTISLTNTGPINYFKGTYIIGFDVVNTMSLQPEFIQLYQSNAGVTAESSYPKFITGYIPYFSNVVSFNASEPSVYPALITFHLNSPDTSLPGSRSLMGCGQ